jgi:putative hydrolase of the HAD superfamily
MIHSFYTGKTLKKWKAIVFDLDDTLYPEKEFVLSGFRAVAAWAELNLGINRNIGEKQLIDYYENGIRGDILNRWLASYNLLSDELVKKTIKVYRDHNPSIFPFPEVKEVLSELKKDFLLGIVTDGQLAVQQRKLNALGINAFFDAFVFSDEWGQKAWKPDKKPFEVISDRLGVPSSQCIYVADNPLKDFFGAKQVGMYAIRIVHPIGEYSTCQPPSLEHNPDFTITSLEKLLNIEFIMSNQT